MTARVGHRRVSVCRLGKRSLFQFIAGCPKSLITYTTEVVVFVRSKSRIYYFKIPVHQFYFDFVSRS